MKITIKHRYTNRQIDGSFLISGDRYSMLQLASQLYSGIEKNNCDRIQIYIKSHEQIDKDKIKSWEE